MTATAAEQAKKPKLDKDQAKQVPMRCRPAMQPGRWRRNGRGDADQEFPRLLLQEFLKVFETLRDEIVNDELLAGQPDFSKQWVKEVRWRAGGSGGGEGSTSACWLSLPLALPHCHCLCPRLTTHLLRRALPVILTPPPPPPFPSCRSPPQMMDYNVPLGKLNRGMAVLDVMQSLAASKGGEAAAAELSEEEAFRANALGWCIEFLQASRPAGSGALGRGQSWGRHAGGSMAGGG